MTVSQTVGTPCFYEEKSGVRKLELVSSSGQQLGKAKSFRKNGISHNDSLMSATVYFFLIQLGIWEKEFYKNENWLQSFNRVGSVHLEFILKTRVLTIFLPAVVFVVEVRGPLAEEAGALRTVLGRIGPAQDVKNHEGLFHRRRA